MGTRKFAYMDMKTKEISFPLGGIGTGCVGLAGNGRLIDWEIFNKPNKGGGNSHSHFSVKTERGGAVIDARVIQSDLPPPWSGGGNALPYNGFGFGPGTDTMAGFPHFEDAVFHGEFPLAEIDFKSKSFPGKMRMTAFNPFIPLNDKDSGIPGAFFDFEVKNTSAEKLCYTVTGVLHNPQPENNINRHTGDGGFNLVTLSSDSLKSEDVKFGDMTLATDAESGSFQEYWYRGSWRDSAEVYWHDLNTPGAFKNRVYPVEKAGKGNHAMLAARVEAAPGETKHIRFVITWSFPNCENYWKKKECSCSASKTWKNYYATLWKDSRESAVYSLKNWKRLFEETKKFKDALFSSSLPDAALDAVSANISILKSPTVLRLEDGTFYGWEGCHPSAGCCEGSCTHVWNYAMALPFLFPRLERSMRDADYKYNLRPDGGMPFRIQLPLGAARSDFRPCADGQLGGVMKVYRDWKICGDTDWLKSVWPAVKASLEFAWRKDNADKWDPDKTGVLHGRQHHTLDVELFGANSWLTGFYLGALKAASEMASALGEKDSAKEYMEIFERGRKWTEENLFNGEYYIQKINLADKSLVERFNKPGEKDAASFYWSDEHGQIKYQYGEGCEIDQTLAQWHANLYGLGDIFDPARVKKAMKALFKHNFKKRMRDHLNTWRLYSLNDEAGITICSWPAGKEKPVMPVPYWAETMNGFEYSAAVLMIQCGLMEEGMAIVEALRDRYDGAKRNPWNEFECGSNYARSMASYSLLNVFSGFSFDMPNKSIGFAPVTTKDDKFNCLWSLGPAWGVYSQTGKKAEIRVLGGEIALKRISLPFKVKKVVSGSKSLEFQNDGGSVVLGRAAVAASGASLVFS